MCLLPSHAWADVGRRGDGYGRGGIEGRRGKRGRIEGGRREAGHEKDL